ncbi:MAG: hypothetical protein JXE07_09040 [Candidatus Aminicenantes bacterium]|nr:hypothetical protein [Candidatus Aminicenantes bacterium]
MLVDVADGADVVIFLFPRRRSLYDFEIACDFLSGYNGFMAEIPVREGNDAKSDTPQEIQDLQLALLRRAGMANRFMLTLMLSEIAISLSRQGLKRRHPELAPEDLDLLFIDYCYGPSLANRCRILRQEKPR